MRNNLSQYPRKLARELLLHSYSFVQSQMTSGNSFSFTEPRIVEQLKLFYDGEEPRGYNDKIKWLMVNDQMPEHIVCSDKLVCRAFVAARIGETYLRRVYQAAETVDGINTDKLPNSFVVKANHDSGSVFVISDLSSWKRAKTILRVRLTKSYGMQKGEWAYSYVVPRVFAEELMCGPIIDYKFHCCDGEVCWAQIIYDRATGQPREVIVDKDYLPLGLHMDDNFVCEKQPARIPICWDEMREIARSLSQGFRYVRVDLYEYQGRPSFGELTFWPRAGNYGTSDEGEFGDLLQFDTSFCRMVIHDFFAEGRSKQSNSLISRLRKWRG